MLDSVEMQSAAQHYDAARLQCEKGTAKEEEKLVVSLCAAEAAFAVRVIAAQQDGQGTSSAEGGGLHHFSIRDHSHVWTV